jgi:hypothetical protein
MAETGIWKAVSVREPPFNKKESWQALNYVLTKAGSNLPLLGKYLVW